MFFGAAALALASFIAPAANSADVPVEESLSPISATIDGWVGYWFLADEKDNASPDEDEGFIYGLDGKLRFDLFDGISVQGDFSFDEVDEGDGEDFYQGGWIGGGHLSWSDPDSGLLGIFAATGTGESDVNENSDFWLVGGEGQLYWDAWTNMDILHWGTASFGRPDLSDYRTGPNLDLPAAARWAASGNIID